MDANNYRSSLLYGLGTGIGAGGLYYLSQYLKDKFRDATHVPSVTEIAAAPISDVAHAEQDEQVLPANSPALENNKAAAVSPEMILFPAVGAGAGALIGSARAYKGKKRQNALLGALLGAGGGLGAAAATSAPVWEAIAKRVPRNWSQMMGGGGNPNEQAPAQTWLHAGMRNTLGLALPAAGVYGGLQVADAVMEQESAKKNRDAVDSARRDYFKTLVGAEDDEEKTAAVVDQFLDAAFVAYTEKSAVGAYQAPTTHDYGAKALPAMSQKNHWLYDAAKKYVDAFGEAGTTALLVSALGAGGVGAKYMYDKTKATSDARNREQARAARERMRGLEAPWVDPRELADVKALAAGGPAARGV